MPNYLSTSFLQPAAASEPNHREQEVHSKDFRGGVKVFFYGLFFLRFDRVPPWFQWVPARVRYIAEVPYV